MPEDYKVLERETNRILPELFRRMAGSGSLSLDTDSMSLAEPHDRHYMEWLARITAKFVLEEQNVWAKQVSEFVEKAEESRARLADLDNLLEKMREAADSDETTLEDMKSLAKRYRTPLEHYYDKMREKREGPKELAERLGLVPVKPKSNSSQT